jgi:hypothetical protein
LSKLCTDGISRITAAVFSNAFALDRSFFISTSCGAEQENRPYGFSPFLLM